MITISKRLQKNFNSSTTIKDTRSTKEFDKKLKNKGNIKKKKLMYNDSITIQKSRKQSSYFERISTTSSTLTNNSTNRSYLGTSIYSTISEYQFNDFNNSYNHNNTNHHLLNNQFSFNNCEAYDLFQLFIKKLNNIKYLQYILHNWVIGNRLIIKYTNRIDNDDTIYSLANLFRVKKTKKFFLFVYFEFFFYIVFFTRWLFSIN